MTTFLTDISWKNAVVDFKEFFTQGNSPSQLSSKLTLEEELLFRYLGAHLIQRAGRLLKMPQSGIMTGQILFQQFYCQKSVTEIALLDAAMACTLIAGKVEECCRRIRDVVNIYYWLYQQARGADRCKLMGYVASEYYLWRDRVTEVEMQVLRSLGFHVQPRQPMGLIANYLNALELTDDPRLGQRATNYTNDALRTVTFVCFQPEVIACAAIKKAAEDLQVELLPAENAALWYRVFDVEECDLEACIELMQSCYTFPERLSAARDALPLTRDELMDFLNRKFGGEECEHPGKPPRDPHEGANPNATRSDGERSDSKSQRYNQSRSGASDRSYFQSRDRNQSRSRSRSRSHQSHNHPNDRHHNFKSQSRSPLRDRHSRDRHSRDYHDDYRQ